MCETSKIAFVAICVRSSYKMPGLNADANITCDFGDGDISHSRSRLPHTHTDSHIVSSIIVRRLLSSP